MLFSATKLRNNIRQLNSRQKRTITRYIIILNLVMLSIMISIAIKIDHMVKDANVYFNQQITPHNLTPDRLTKLHYKIPVDINVSVSTMQDIDLKDQYLEMELIVGMSYNKKDFKDGSPLIDLYNGEIKSQKLISSTLKNGRVNDQFVISVKVQPNYQSELFPVDKELVTLVFMPMDYSANYYFWVSNFLDNTDYDDLGQGSYKLVKIGYNNSIESEITRNENNQEITSYYGFDRSYALFHHRILYSYIKSIQYILLSLLIAVFALLINAKQNSPKNGRITVIGSSVFSLAANVFQINSTNRVISSITIIDLITSFAALVIFFAFLITLRTLIFIDEDGYPTSRVFDQAMFATLLLNMIIFFTGIYLFA